MLNKVQIIGRLGQDPESVSNGVVRLNVATTETWKDRESGERREKTEWHQVAFFGKLAEVATNYLHKGSLVYIEGSLETRRYEKDGQTHHSTSIKGRELRMLDKRGDGADERASAGEDVRGNSHSGAQRGNRQGGNGSPTASRGEERRAPRAAPPERSVEGQSRQPVDDPDFEGLDIPF